MILTDTSERETKELCDRIRREFDKPNGRNKFPFKLTVSIGYARARLNSGEDVHRLFKMADNAMYSDKQQWHCADKHT